MVRRKQNSREKGAHPTEHNLAIMCFTGGLGWIGFRTKCGKVWEGVGGWVERVEITVEVGSWDGSWNWGEVGVALEWDGRWGESWGWTKNGVGIWVGVGQKRGGWDRVGDKTCLRRSGFRWIRGGGGVGWGWVGLSWVWLDSGLEGE